MTLHMQRTYVNDKCILIVYNAGFLQVSTWLVQQVNKGTIVLTANNSSLVFEAELRGPPSGLSLSYSPSLIHPARQVAFQLKQSKVRLLSIL